VAITLVLERCIFILGFFWGYLITALSVVARTKPSVTVNHQLYSVIVTLYVLFMIFFVVMTNLLWGGFGNSFVFLMIGSLGLWLFLPFPCFFLSIIVDGWGLMLVVWTL
jgi:hypothetical protein